MDLKYKYWHFVSALDDNVVDKILSAGKKKLDDEGHKANISDNSKVDIMRESKVCWFNEQWLYDLLWPYLNIANKNAGWNFDYDISEEIQFTEYSKSGHYNWHVDGGSDHNSVYTKENTKWKNYYGKVRKLSMTVNLSDKNDYEGGDLMFKLGSGFDGKEDTELCDVIKKKGSIVVFPSFIHHKISPINSGNRYSLVMWTLGKPFR